jgi:hypothetical protein
MGGGHPRGMKTASMWKVAARWLRRVDARAEVCSVADCRDQPTIAVAGDASGATFMCVGHAVAWSESTLCRDYAQHNSGASPAALSAWLNASHAAA